MAKFLSLKCWIIIFCLGCVFRLSWRIQLKLNVWIATFNQRFRHNLFSCLLMDTNLGMSLPNLIDQLRWRFTNFTVCRAWVEDESSTMGPVQDYSPQLQLSWNKEAEQASLSTEKSLNHNNEGISPAMPPSFTSLLLDCCSEVKQGIQAVTDVIWWFSFINLFTDVFFPCLKCSLCRPAKFISWNRSQIPNYGSSLLLFVTSIWMPSC